MAQRITGIDIGTSSIKVVQLKRGLMNIELIDSLVREIPRDSLSSHEDDIVTILMDLFHRRRIRGDILTVSIPANSLSTRVITLPFSDPKKIEQVIPYEIENQIPFPIEDVIIDYHIIELTPDGSKILVIIVPKETIRQKIDLLSKAGLDPAILEVDSFALYNFSQFYLREEEKDIVIIEIGASTTSISLITNGRLYAIRNITIGGDIVTNTLSKELSIPFNEAEKLKYNLVLNTDGTIIDRVMKEGRLTIKGALEPLVKEIKMTLHAYETEIDKNIPYLFICGGGSKLEGIKEYLSIELNKEIIDLTEENRRTYKKGLILKTNGDISLDPIFSHALGLVLRETLKKKGARINLRKGEFVYGKMAKESISKLIYILVAGVVVMGLALSDLYLRYYLKDIRVKGLKAEIRRVFKETFPDVKNIVNEIQQMKAKIEDVKRDVSILGDGDLTILNILKELTESIPEDTRIDIQDITIDNDRIRIEAETDSFDSVDKIKNEFKRIGFVKEVNISDAKVSADQSKVRFRANITMYEGI